MPAITDFTKTKKINKKFQKKEYRPWDIAVNDPNEKAIIIEQDKILNTTTSLSNEEAAQETPFNIDLNMQWRRLFGAKKQLLVYILKNIEEVNQNEVITQIITLEQLTQDLKIPINTIKGSLAQLKKHNLIKNEDAKPGRGGYARYKIPKKIFLFIEEKLKTTH